MFKTMLGCGIAVYLSVGMLQPVYAQGQAYAHADTLNLSIKDAEKLFLDNNLQLLAQHYNVEAGKALVQQAKLWDNPVLNTDQNVYTNNKFFEHSKGVNGNPAGQYYIQVAQLVRTANKRGKQITLANTNATISQLQFDDVLRNLKLQLRTDYYTLVQMDGNMQLYTRQKEQLDKLLQGMEQQYKSGNIARKDLLRIQALQMTLAQDMVENGKQLTEVQAELNTLLGIGSNTYIKPYLGVTMPVTLPQIGTDAMLATAKENNAAYRLQQIQLQYEQQNLSLQKAMAVPDITVGPNFDKNSNYTPNYFGLGVSLPIPLLNRNQGNIKAALWQVKSAESNAQLADLQLQNELASAYNKLKLTLEINSDKQDQFYKDYNQLYDNILQSYKDRQIGLVEFIDYFDAYKSTRQLQLSHDLNLQLAKEELNYVTGVDIL